MAQGEVVSVYQQHTLAIWAINWSPNSKLIASASDDTTVQIWNAQDSNNICTCVYRAESGPQTLSWSPLSGNKVAAGYTNGTITVWEVPSGKSVQSLFVPNDEEIFVVDWSPDERYIAAGVDNYVRIWDVQTGQLHLTYKGHDRDVFGVTWSPDTHFVASSGMDTEGEFSIHVWSAADGLLFKNLVGHNATIHATIWSPDGKKLVSASEDGTVRVWDVATGQEIVVYDGHNTTVWAADWSPDSKYIVSGSDDCTVHIWNAQTGKQEYVYMGHTGDLWVRSVSWSPDGSSIASGGFHTTPDDELGGSVQVWKAF